MRGGASDLLECYHAGEENRTGVEDFEWLQTMQLNLMRLNYPMIAY